MRFRVDPAVFDSFPEMTVVVVTTLGIDNGTPREAVTDGWRAAWQGAAAAAEFGNAQSHPRIAPWRQAWQRLGISGKRYPSSIEALVRRVLKGGDPPSINPLVDFYNAVSLRHVVPAGGFDLDDLDGDLSLRITTGGDTFQALDEEHPEPVPPGEVAYACGTTVLTRHFVWRQSRVGLIDRSTRNVVLVSEILGELPAGVVDSVERDLLDGLASDFGVEATACRMHADRREMDW